VAHITNSTIPLMFVSKSKHFGSLTFLFPTMVLTVKLSHLNLKQVSVLGVAGNIIALLNCYRTLNV
jgi:cell division protein FtsW (lipid II flippase)